MHQRGFGISTYPNGFQGVPQLQCTIPSTSSRRNYAYMTDSDGVQTIHAMTPMDAPLVVIHQLKMECIRVEDLPLATPAVDILLHPNLFRTKGCLCHYQGLKKQVEAK